MKYKPLPKIDYTYEDLIFYVTGETKIMRATRRLLPFLTSLAMSHIIISSFNDVFKDDTK
jgi:hypothetical protein